MKSKSISALLLGLIMQVFEALIDRTRSRLDLRQIMTIFGRKRRPHFKGSPKGRRLKLERNLERPEYDLDHF